MNHRSPSLRSTLCVAFVLFLALPLLRTPAQPHASNLTPPSGKQFRAVSLYDVNRDGLGDLVLVVMGTESPRSRTVDIHLARGEEPRFANAPDRSERLTPDVGAFALADVGGASGAEIVLFNRSGVWAREADGRRVRKLFDADFLWQLLDDDEILFWSDGVRDLDADGLDDFVVPEPGGWRVALQTRDAKGVGEFPRVFSLRVPEEAADEDLGTRGAQALTARGRRKSLEVSLRTGSREGGEKTLLEVSESAPAPQLQDWDGDGDVDILARTATRLHVWIQEPRGRFSVHPSRSFTVPVEEDRERRLDISYSAHAADLNGDARVDCVFVAGNRFSKDVRSQILVYVQGSKGRGRAATTAEEPLFGPAGIPYQLLPLVGFAGFPRLDDVNGDGRLDLSVATFRPDLLTRMRSESLKSIDLGFSIFLNQGGTFSPRADLHTSLTLSAEGLDEAADLLLARVVPDLNGDGIGELLLQESPHGLRLFGLRRTGEGLALSESPLWSYALPFVGLAQLAKSKKPLPELVVSAPDRVLHLRFK